MAPVGQVILSPVILVRQVILSPVTGNRYHYLFPEVNGII
jgi:hypothetical protein